MEWSPDLIERLRQAHARFVADVAADPLGLRPIAASINVLPVVRGWERCGGLRLDGAPVEFDYQPPHTIEMIRDGSLVYYILGLAAARFPELVALRPARPTTAIDCPSCGGSGYSASVSNGLCVCGALGWIVPPTVE